MFVMATDKIFHNKQVFPMSFIYFGLSLSKTQDKCQIIQQTDTDMRKKWKLN